LRKPYLTNVGTDACIVKPKGEGPSKVMTYLSKMIKGDSPPGRWMEVSGKIHARGERKKYPEGV